ncbi:hypothetical protein TELCIR_23576, partial [Teladorsagia circumcincta]
RFPAFTARNMTIALEDGKNYCKKESAPVSLRGLMSFNAEMAFVVTNMLGALAGMGSVLGTKLGWLVGSV